jgi:hypothetical protein
VNPHAINKLLFIVIELTVSTGYFVLIPARKEETVMLKRMFLLLVVTFGMSLSIAGLPPPLAGFP